MEVEICSAVDVLYLVLRRRELRVTKVTIPKASFIFVIGFLDIYMNLLTTGYCPSSNLVQEPYLTMSIILPISDYSASAEAYGVTGRECLNALSPSVHSLVSV